MTSPIIQVENLGKKYILKHQSQERYTALRDVISHRIRSVGHRLMRSRTPPSTQEEFWALKDVSFEVQRGDRVGIIGRNGAGKSTLLKILSRITEPTHGRIRIQGRVASLLEVGTGFHPELTGRENIFLNGAILGMSKAEIKRKFDEIVAFAEVEKFLDTPVKRYSSGMYVRLAFSVAAHLEPEILVVDEVLAVGDATFQKKCLGKMEDVGKQGRTVLFVSHNMATITQLCQKVSWLDKGCLSLTGNPEYVVSQYLKHGSSNSGAFFWESGFSNPGIEEFELRSISIKNDQNEITSQLDARNCFWIEIEYVILKKLPYCRIGIIINTLDGIYVLTTYDADLFKYNGAREQGHFVSKCKIPGNLLSSGSFTLSVNAGIEGVRNLAFAENIINFEIQNVGTIGSHHGGKRKGLINPNLEWDRINL